jgi:hypothetical protein
MKGKTSLDIRQLFVTDEKHALEKCTRLKCLREAVGMNHPSIFMIVRPFLHSHNPPPPRHHRTQSLFSAPDAQPEPCLVQILLPAS